MAHLDLIDGIVGGGLLLLTGTEAALDAGSALEIISKFGVVAVLWFWLKDMRAQIKEQTVKSEERYIKLAETFEKETDEMRENYDKIINKLTEEYHLYSSKMEQVFKDQKDLLKDLNDQIRNDSQRT